MIRCPLCGRDAHPVQSSVGGVEAVLLQYHDNVPPCRSVCIASLHTVEEAEAMAADQRRHRMQEPTVDE